MKPDKSFNVDFDYALSEKVKLNVSAKAELHHSNPYYHITQFHFKHNLNCSALFPDIRIMAIKEKDKISWVHTDSRKETTLSAAIGKAIEERGEFEIADQEEPTFE